MNELDIEQKVKSDKAYLVTIKIDNIIDNRIIIAEDVFDVDKKVKETFETIKGIEWWEIVCNYGKPVI